MVSGGGPLMTLDDPSSGVLAHAQNDLQQGPVQRPHRAGCQSVWRGSGGEAVEGLMRLNAPSVISSLNLPSLR